MEGVVIEETDYIQDIPLAEELRKVFRVRAGEKLSVAAAKNL